MAPVSEPAFLTTASFNLLEIEIVPNEATGVPVENPPPIPHPPAISSNPLISPGPNL